MTPQPRSARPLALAFLLSALFVGALALPPLDGIWESRHADAVQTGPTSPTQPPTSVTQPPTSPPTAPPTEPPTSVAPTSPPTRAPAPTAPRRTTTTVRRSATTGGDEGQAGPVEETTTTTLPELLVPAGGAPEDGENPEDTQGGEDAGLTAGNKVWLSVALLLALGFGVGVLTLLYFLHTRPETDDDEGEGEGEVEEDWGLPVDEPAPVLVGASAAAGAGAGAGARPGATGPPTTPMPVVRSGGLPERPKDDATSSPAKPDDPLAVLADLLNEPAADPPTPGGAHDPGAG